MALPPDFLSGLEDDLHTALDLCNKGDAVGSPLQFLSLYQRALQQNPNGIRASTNQVLNQGLSALGEQSPEAVAILRYRFFDEKPANQIAALLNFAEGTVYKKQRESLILLANVIRQQEWTARTQQQGQWIARLENASYTQLFGLDARLDALLEQLVRPAPPWLVAIEGIGGIGKTALADALVRRLLATGEIGNGRLADMGWVTARQRILNGGGAIKELPLPALTSAALIDALFRQLFDATAQTGTLTLAQQQSMLQMRLKAAPHLIVIDNLETVLDVEHLLATLRSLANPTRFLLTTRHSLYDHADLYHYVTPPLSEADALALVRFEAALRNLPALAQVEAAEFQPIYATVGGNPLALRLVVGQLHVHSLPHILDDLRQARGFRMGQLYTFIYRQAWETLDEKTRRVLLLMPLVLESGGDLPLLTALGSRAGLAADVVRDGLDQLVSLNLVDSRGDLQQRRYAIHSLTRTFLQQQVLRWQEE